MYLFKVFVNVSGVHLRTSATGGWVYAWMFYEVGLVCDLSSGSARKVEVLPAKIDMMTDVVPTGLSALFVWMPWVFLHRAGGIAFLRLW